MSQHLTSTLYSTAFHPDYCFDDGDIVLCSSDGKSFKVHAVILRLASDVFAQLFDLPRANDETALTPIVVTESAEILTAILDLVYPHRGLSLVDIISADFFKELCIVVREKYLMHGAALHLRNIFFALPQGFCALTRYAVACRLGWYYEARAISTSTLDASVFSSKSLAVLKSIDSEGIVKLLSLHVSRADRVIEGLQGIGVPIITMNYGPATIWWLDVHTVSPVCSTNRSTDVALAGLKFFISEELKRLPSGDALRFRSFWERPIMAGVWDAVCGCGSCFMSLDRTMAAVIRGLDRLPRSIDDLENTTTVRHFPNFLSSLTIRLQGFDIQMQLTFDVDPDTA